jgi:hypothetical protein
VFHCSGAVHLVPERVATRAVSLSLSAISPLKRHVTKYIFLPLGATAEGELWPPEQSASILLYPEAVWFLNNLVFML